MDFLVPKFRRDGNAKIDSLYYGVAPGGMTVTAIAKPSLDGSRKEVTRSYESGGLAPGQGGRIGILILGGMETTLDEVEYILEAKKQKPFVPRRSSGEIASMCYELLERRNSLIRHYQKNPSEAPKKTARLYLPVRVRQVKTPVSGLTLYQRNGTH